MTVTDEQLSAYLDGELPEDDARAIDEALAQDPALQAALESLVAANDMARDAFDAMKDDPVPLAPGLRHPKCAAGRDRQ